MTNFGFWALRLAATLTLLTSSFTAAQNVTTVPTQVKFSGAVQSPRSRVIGMTFALYKDEQGGAPLWMETQSVSLDASGRYTIQLGTTFPEGLPKELFASGEARWLGVQPEGQTEQPRVLLVSVPYALKAADAETIGGLPASAFVLKNPKIELGTAAKNKANVVSKNTPPPPGPPTNVTTSGGTVNLLPLFNTATDIENSVVAQSGTSIGINTATPGATLDVNGTANVRGNLSSTAYVNAASGYQLGGRLFAFDAPDFSSAFLGFAGNTAATGTQNTGAGYLALSTVSSGFNNAGFGTGALKSATTGYNNTAMGLNALYANVTSGNSTAVGYLALRYATAGPNLLSVPLHFLPTLPGPKTQRLEPRRFRTILLAASTLPSAASRFIGIPVEPISPPLGREHSRTRTSESDECDGDRRLQ